jgi:hypothetical protein
MNKVDKVKGVVLVTDVGPMPDKPVIVGPRIIKDGKLVTVAATTSC